MLSELEFENLLDQLLSEFELKRRFVQVLLDFELEQLVRPSSSSRYNSSEFEPELRRIVRHGRAF
eukprot:13041566-Heterocapsa_arctica.AAC.1